MKEESYLTSSSMIKFITRSSSISREDVYEECAIDDEAES